MRPRRTGLFSNDLDTQTLVRYVDRFLMFYIKTGDKLQRTSVWQKKWKADLNTFGRGLAPKPWHCRWIRSTSDPNVDDININEIDINSEKLKRFRHFVNSEKADDNVVFVTERKQIRPATPAERADDGVVKIYEPA